MENKDKKKKIKEVVDNLKDKLGNLKTKNVREVKKLKPTKTTKEKHKEAKESRKKTQAVSYGPRGGQYALNAQGEKEYIKKSIDEWLEQVEDIDRFIDQYKNFKGLM